MKQKVLFEQKEKKSIYNKAVGSPVYEPNNKKPHILELCDDSKCKRRINEIKALNLSEDEEKFLIKAATRHIVFNYEKIADYYANSSKDVQELMEKSALVIIDFHMAIEMGYVRLSEDIRKQYMESYEN